MDKKFIALLVVSAILISGCPSPTPPQQCPTCNASNTTSVQPKRNVEDVKTFIGRIMDSYTDLVNAAPTTPVFRSDDRTWEETVVLQTSSGAKNVVIQVYDDNLSLKNVYIAGPVPALFSADSVVAKGIVKLSGKMNCSEANNITVMEFFDLYCDPCIAAESGLQQFREKFNGSINYEYKILMTHSLDLVSKYGLDNVSLGDYYLACARDQPGFEAFKDCAIQTYDKHKETPLEPQELDACAAYAKLDNDSLTSCVKTAYVDLNKDSMLAETYSITGTGANPPSGTPVVVVDCQYKAAVENAGAALCYAHPELKGCA